ncbi:hypothetical protein MCETHM1_03381 [Flavobacteriaceae bacterium]
MFKTTLLRVANPITFVLFLLFFTTSNAQSVDKKVNDEKKTYGFLKSPFFFTDLINSEVTKENDVLIISKTSNTICNNEIVGILKEADVLDTNFDSIMFVQYYKQFVVFYKNIS